MGECLWADSWKDAGRLLAFGIQITVASSHNYRKNTTVCSLLILLQTYGIRFSGWIFRTLLSILSVPGLFSELMIAATSSVVERENFELRALEAITWIGMWQSYWSLSKEEFTEVEVVSIEQYDLCGVVGDLVM